MSGVTGAVISWDHELDEWLNPHLNEVASIGPSIPALELAAQVEAQDPRARVSYVPLAAEPGHALSVFVDPRRDPATGRLFELDYNQVFLDPVTGAEQGRRYLGCGLADHHRDLRLVPLRPPLQPAHSGIWGIDRWGMWLLGVVAIIWTVDCFVGLYLTLPVARAADPSRPATVTRQLARGWWARWAPAWRIKTHGSPYRINFDLHRAFGLWTLGAAVHPGLHRLLAEPLPRGVLSGDVAGLGSDTHAVRRARARGQGRADRSACSATPR